MTTKNLSSVHLLLPQDMQHCRDKRIWLACEGWIGGIPKGKPLCLLCPHVWHDRKDYQRTIGAFYVLLPESEDGQTMVAGVCQTCVDQHGAELPVHCFEQLQSDFADVEYVSHPHGTRQ